MQWQQVVGSVRVQRADVSKSKQLLRLARLQALKSERYSTPDLLNLGVSAKNRRGLVLRLLPARFRRISESWLEGGPNANFKKDRRDREPYHRPTGQTSEVELDLHFIQLTGGKFPYLRRPFRIIIIKKIGCNCPGGWRI